MASIGDAPQESTHRAKFNEVKRCPRCQSDSLVWLAQMRPFDREHDWYRCKGCGDEFVIEREVQ